MKLTIIHHPPSPGGSKQVFEDREVIRIGRAPENEIVFNSKEFSGVSAHHATIKINANRVIIEDNKSTNGLLVGGLAVSSSELTDGDTVQLGPGGPSIRVAFAGARSDSGKTPLPKTALQPRAAEKKYGEKTVGMLVERALVQAGILRQSGTKKSTEYFEELVETKVMGTRTRLRRWLIVGILAVLAVGVGVGIYFYRNRSVHVYQTTQINYGDAAGGSIATSNRYAVFLLAGEPKSGGELQGFCSAFAINQNTLVTNAHCVPKAHDNFTHVAAIMNGMSTHRYPVTQMVMHPSYREGTISPDIAVLRIAGSAPTWVTLAPEAELRQITPGSPVFLYGFPGRLNREEAPEATFIKGDIGRVTTFSQSLGRYEENSLLQHSAYSAGGTSGSPMFNNIGHVIGVNAGGYIENGQALTGYNFGIRIDLAYPLLPKLNQH